MNKDNTSIEFNFNDVAQLAKTSLNLTSLLNDVRLVANKYFVDNVVDAPEFKSTTLYAKYKIVNSDERRLVKMMRLLGFQNYGSRNDELYRLALTVVNYDVFRVLLDETTRRLAKDYVSDNERYECEFYKRDDANLDEAITRYAYARMCRSIIVYNGNLLENCVGGVTNERVKIDAGDRYDKFLKVIDDEECRKRVVNAWNELDIELDGRVIDVRKSSDLLAFFSYVDEWFSHSCKNQFFKGLVERNAHFVNTHVGLNYSWNRSVVEKVTELMLGLCQFTRHPFSCNEDEISTFAKVLLENLETKRTSRVVGKPAYARVKDLTVNDNLSDDDVRLMSVLREYVTRYETLDYRYHPNVETEEKQCDVETLGYYNICRRAVESSDMDFDRVSKPLMLKSTDFRVDGKRKSTEYDAFIEATLYSINFVKPGRKWFVFDERFARAKKPGNKTSERSEWSTVDGRLVKIIVHPNKTHD